jgi:hypothetical protein
LGRHINFPRGRSVLRRSVRLGIPGKFFDLALDLFDDLGVFRLFLKILTVLK